MKARFVLVALVLLVIAGIWWAMSGDAAGPVADRGAAAAVEEPAREGPRTKGRGRDRPAEAAPGESRAPEADAPVETGADLPSRPGPRAKHRIQVTVTDSAGGPAHGATVRVVDAFAHHFGFRNPGDFDSAKTDAEGNAELAATKDATLLVLAERGNEAAVGERIPAPPRNPGQDKTSEVALQLGDAFVVRGSVVDESGNGRPRALVTLWFATGRDPIGVGLSRVCGEDGEFRFPAVPRDLPNTPFVDLEARSRGYVPGRLRVLQDEPYPDGVRIELARGVSVKGRCVTEEGKPVYPVRIKTPDAARDLLTTGAEGTFDLPGIAGGSLLLIPALHAPVRFDGLDTRGGDVDLGDVVFREGGAISGVVVDVEGKAVRGAGVSAGVEAFQGLYRTALSNEKGRFEVEHLVAGPHFLTVSARVPFPAGEHFEARVEGVEPGGAELRVVLTGALTLVVHFLEESDRSPVAVSDVKLTATPTEGDGTPVGWAWAGSDLKTVRVEFEKAGLYDIKVEIPGYTVGELKGIEVSAQRGVEVDVLFRKAPDSD